DKADDVLLAAPTAGEKRDRDLPGGLLDLGDVDLLEAQPLQREVLALGLDGALLYLAAADAAFPDECSHGSPFRLRAHGHGRAWPAGPPWCACAGLRQHGLELLRIGGARHRLLERDLTAQKQRRQRLVERLHAVLALSDLHLRVDLMQLVLADQVSDGRVRDQDLERHHAARAGGARQERLAQNALQYEREL